MTLAVTYSAYNIDGDCILEREVQRGAKTPPGPLDLKSLFAIAEKAVARMDDTETHNVVIINHEGVKPILYLFSRDAGETDKLRREGGNVIEMPSGALARPN